MLNITEPFMNHIILYSTHFWLLLWLKQYELMLKIMNDKWLLSSKFFYDCTESSLFYTQ